MRTLSTRLAALEHRHPPDMTGLVSLLDGVYGPVRTTAGETMTLAEFRAAHPDAPMRVYECDWSADSARGAP